MKTQSSNTLSPSERLLLCLLRFSIGSPGRMPANNCLPKGITEETWQECYELSKKQGVKALAWDGIEKLPKEEKPSKPLLLTWGAEVMQYEKRYLRYCKTVNELSSFYKSKGIELVGLKGVGLSTVYPVPNHREGGDLDIYTYSSDKAKMSDGDANALADKLMEERGITVNRKRSKKHSMFVYKGIMVENHKSFLNVHELDSAVKLEKLLHEILSPKEVSLANGEYKVMVPSLEFNAVFVSFHALQHYGCGLALHHLCDWACLKKRGCPLPSCLSDKKYSRFIAALDYLAFSLFGIGEDEKDHSEGLSEEILSEIFHPLYGSAVQTKSKASIIIYKSKRFMHRTSIRHRVVGESRTKALWESIAGHLKEPKTIFKTQQ